MIKIRLSRVGVKNKPSFRIVVVDERAKKGSALETLGFWQPVKNIKKIDTERVGFWLTKGAKATRAVEVILQEK